MIEFIMPENKKDKGENPIVDSLAVASKWTIVSKCVLHGLIYVWNLKASVREVDKLREEGKKDVGDDEGNAIIEQEVFMMANLKWLDTDNFYMNLGCHKGTKAFKIIENTMSYISKLCSDSEYGLVQLCLFRYNLTTRTSLFILLGQGLIACGDDKGQIWLYNQPQFGCDPAMEGVMVAGRDQGDAKKDSSGAIPTLESSTRLSWPEVQDDYQENLKVPLINKVAASHDGDHIVAVTSNNMVCIWRRTSNKN
jgi:hypothetical protein